MSATREIYQGKKLFEWALDIQESKMARAHISVAYTVSGIATACLHLAQYKEAGLNLQEALEILKNPLGEEMQSTTFLYPR